MLPTRTTALAHLSALAARPSGYRIIPLYAADPARAGSFDQSGVEPRKEFARGVLPALTSNGTEIAAAGTHHASTTVLIARFHALRGEG